MKYILLFIISTYMLQPVKTNRQLFDDFHTIYAKHDFKKMNELLADDFVGLDEKEAVSFTKPGYIGYMTDWNMVFDTKWNVESVSEKGSLIKSIEYDTDIFNDYFYGGSKCRIEYTYTFEKDKIKSIQTKHAPGTDELETVYDERFGKFYEWVSFNYPAKLKYCTKRDKQSAIETKKLLEAYLVFVNKKV
ncbi:MAG: hypothetical protein QM737_06470 [Ferruginibacter sp.]